jgi:hypothetical protein
VANVVDLQHSATTRGISARASVSRTTRSGKGKTVLRGGYGIYYDTIIFEVPGYPRVQDDRALTINEYSGSVCTLPWRSGPSEISIPVSRRVLPLRRAARLLRILSVGSAKQGRRRDHRR